MDPRVAICDETVLELAGCDAQKSYNFTVAFRMLACAGLCASDNTGSLKGEKKELACT